MSKTSGKKITAFFLAAVLILLNFSMYRINTSAIPAAGYSDTFSYTFEPIMCTTDLYNIHFGESILTCSFYNMDGKNTEKSLSSAEGYGKESGDRFIKMECGYDDTSASAKANSSMRLQCGVTSSLTSGKYLVIESQFMIPNNSTEFVLNFKYNNNQWGTYLSVLNSNITIGATTIPLTVNHWYDVVFTIQCNSTSGSVFIDGVEYPCSLNYPITRMDYPCMMLYRSTVEGEKSTVFYDNYKLYESDEEYYVDTEDTSISSDIYSITGSVINCSELETVGDILDGIKSGEYASHKVMSGKNEVTDRSLTLSKDMTLLVSTTSGNSAEYFFNLLEDVPDQYIKTDDFSDKDVHVTADTPQSNSYYNNSSTALFEGVFTDSVNYYLNNDDFAGTGEAPYSGEGNNGFVFHADADSAATVDSRIQLRRGASFYSIVPYYNYILEFDIISTEFNSDFSITRKIGSSWMVIDILHSSNTIKFGSKSLPFFENTYYHVVCEITAKGTYNVYVNDELLSSMSCDNVSFGTTLFFLQRNRMSGESEYLIDNVKTYLKASAYDPSVYDADPTSDTYGINESDLTVYSSEQGSGYTVESLRSGLRLPDGASMKFFSSDGKEITSGTIKNGDLIAIYPACGAAPKIYTVGIKIALSQSSIFGNGMVIQRDKEIHIFGFSNHDGITVTATLGSNTGSAVSENGRWDVVLPAMSAAKGLTLTISADGMERPMIYTNVDIGEVWLLGGQSNMQFTVANMEDAIEYTANADNYDNLRIYYQEQSGSFLEANDTVSGSWQTASAQNIQKFSAIGYVMATRLANELDDDVTVAVIDAYYAGSKIQAWLDLETLEGSYSDDYNTYLTNKNYYESNGTFMSGYKWTTIPSTCYNSMVYPIAGYGVKGVIWYQGEGNSGEYSRYESYYNSLTDLWRRDFNDPELPFVVIQLAPYIFSNNNMRNTQYQMVENDPYSYLITSGTDGPVYNYQDNVQGYGYNHVHPSRKSEIGLRTADLLLAEIYGIGSNEPYAAPSVVSVTADGGTVTLTFDSDIILLWGNTATGFELGDGSKYADADAVIDGNKIILTASGISNAVYVRYAYKNLISECEDGTLIIPTKDTISSDKTQTTITHSGGSYVFVAGDNEAIRSTNGGNVTNATGYPAPSFLIEIN